MVPERARSACEIWRESIDFTGRAPAKCSRQRKSSGGRRCGVDLVVAVAAAPEDFSSRIRRVLCTSACSWADLSPSVEGHAQPDDDVDAVARV